MTEKKLTLAGTILAVGAAFAAGAVIMMVAGRSEETKDKTTYDQGRKAGIVESICAEKTGQYDPYVRRYFPIQKDPLVEAIEKCELCKKGQRK
jgi:hypothetical protein